MKQIITRVDEELAMSLKRRARSSGESVNAYVNRLLRIAVSGSPSERGAWKAAALAGGRLVARGPGAKEHRAPLEFRT